MRLVPGIEDAPRGHGSGKSPFKCSLFAMRAGAQRSFRVRGQDKRYVEINCFVKLVKNHFFLSKYFVFFKQFLCKILGSLLLQTNTCFSFILTFLVVCKDRITDMWKSKILLWVNKSFSCKHCFEKYINRLLVLQIFFCFFFYLYLFFLCIRTQTLICGRFFSLKNFFEDF